MAEVEEAVARYYMPTHLYIRCVWTHKKKVKKGDATPQYVNILSVITETSDSSNSLTWLIYSEKDSQGF